MNDTDKRRVLSIQSHVVHGYVGNKSATFPLQLLGFEVDAINSVQFSNHTGYKVFKGEILNDQYLDQLVDGLAANGLDNYSHLLTGYVRSASFLKRIAQLVPSLKRKNPNLVYVCDPVLGDNGKLYVPEELIEIYRTEIIPLADIVTPNHFELEILSGVKIDTIEDVKIAIKRLHTQGPRIVTISSITLDNKLLSFTSSREDDTLIRIDIPIIPTNYTGSGDLFAALFLAHTEINKDNLKVALEKTINSLHAVLLRTYEYYKSLKNDPSIQEAKIKELKLINSKADIENPPNKLTADYLN